MVDEWGKKYYFIDEGAKLKRLKQQKWFYTRSNYDFI